MHSQVLLRLVVALILVATQARAALVTYVATGTILRSNLPSEIAVGDEYILRLTFDLDALDTHPDPWYGEFSSSQIEFRLNPLRSIGEYGGGTAVGRIQTADANGGGGEDRFHVFASEYDRGTDFDDFGGHEFGGVGFSLVDSTGSSPIDHGTGGTKIGEVIGAPLNLDAFADRTFWIYPAMKAGFMEGTIDTLTIVPEPRAGVLLGVCGWLVGRRRRASRLKS